MPHSEAAVLSQVSRDRRADGRGEGGPLPPLRRNVVPRPLRLTLKDFPVLERGTTATSWRLRLSRAQAVKINDRKYFDLLAHRG
jgi:hypothetical protein